MADVIIKISIEIIKIIPSILWFIFILIVLLLFYQPLRELFPYLRDLKVMGVELSFVEDKIAAAIKLAETFPEWKGLVPPADIKRALDRLKKHLDVFKDAQILWVDENPKNNINERKIFRKLKTNVDIAKDTKEALDMLKNGGYDLVISDIARGKDATAGLKFLEQFRKEDKTTPVVFYIGEFFPEKGVPPYAFGITDRLDELLHLTLDTLERKKY